MNDKPTFDFSVNPTLDLPGEPVGVDSVQADLTPAHVNLVEDEPIKAEGASTLVKVSNTLYTQFINPLFESADSIVDIINIGIISAVADDLDRAAHYNEIVQELETTVYNTRNADELEVLKYFNGKRNTVLDNARKVIVNQGQYIKGINKTEDKSPEANLLSALKGLPLSKRAKVLDQMISLIDSLSVTSDEEIEPVSDGTVEGILEE